MQITIPENLSTRIWSRGGSGDAPVDCNLAGFFAGTIEIHFGSRVENPALMYVLAYR